MSSLPDRFEGAVFIGRTTMDAVYWLGHLPAEDTKVFANAFRVAPGGPARNAAIAHALLGGKTTLISTLGRGIWADAVRKRLGTLGVRIVDLAEGTTYETPLTTVLIGAEKATRTIVNPPASSVELRKVESWNDAWGPLPRVALSDGFYLPEVLPLLRNLKSAGTALCLDGGSWKPGTEEFSPLLTAAICSERFVAPENEHSVDATLRWFCQRGVPHVAVTRGGKPIVGLGDGQRFEIAIERVEAVDTLGAGDVLHGAFCFHFAQGLGFEKALGEAAAVATRSCTGMGIEDWAKDAASPPE